MRAESDAESLVKMAVDHHPAFGKRDSQMSGLDLKDEALEGDGVVASDGALFFDGEDQIKIQRRLDWYKGRTGLLRFDFESLVEIADEEFFQESIGLLFCVDTVQTELVYESALKSPIDTLTPAAGLGGISRDRPDTQLGKGPADLSQMSFLDRPACLGSEEEMTGPVRIQGAEDTLFCDTVSEKPHAAHRAFLLDQFHLIDFARGIIHQNEQIKEDPRKGRDPLMRAAVKVKHHTGEWFSWPPSPVFSPDLEFFHKPCGLKGAFHKGVAPGDAVMLPELLTEVSDIKTLIRGSVQLQNPLEFLKGNPFGAWSPHAPVKNTIITVCFIPGFPAFHGPVGNPDDIGGLSPVDFA